MAGGRFKNLKGGRGQRTGEDAWVGQRESEEYRRLLQKQEGWALSTGHSLCGSFDIQSTGAPGSTTRFLPLRELDRQFTLTHFKAPMGTASLEYALYFWEDRKLHIVPRSRIEVTLGAAPTVYKLGGTVTLPPEARIFVAYRIVAAGTAPVLRIGDWVSIPAKEATFSDLPREFAQDDLSDVLANQQFVEFAYLSTDATNVL